MLCIVVIIYYSLVSTYLNQFINQIFYLFINGLTLLKENIYILITSYIN